MNILLSATAHGNNIAHHGRTYSALPVRIRVTLSLSRALLPSKNDAWLIQPPRTVTVSHG